MISVHGSGAFNSCWPARRAGRAGAAGIAGLLTGQRLYWLRSLFACGCQRSMLACMYRYRCEHRTRGPPPLAGDCPSETVTRTGAGRATTVRVPRLLGTYGIYVVAPSCVKLPVRTYLGGLLKSAERLSGQPETQPSDPPLPGSGRRAASDE